MDATDATLMATDPTGVTLGATAADADAPELERGEALGRYVVLERLGAGGMGVVYAAYDPELDRKVALKLVRNPDARVGDTEPTRLQREAQAMAKLSHPNVITVHDVGVVKGRVFIAMEFVDGQTLSSWLAQPRERSELLDVFVRAGAGLLAAHEAGICHRDFKPDNVLLGRDGRVRVMDFGLARADEDLEARTPLAGPSSPSTDAITSSLTATGAIMGTPAYMAPEQHLGERADARADQFAFCVALHEGLYGRRPFVGDNVHALAFAVLSGDIVAAPKHSQVPAWLRAIVVRGLASDPAARFPSMRELLDAIEAGRRSPGSSGIMLATLGVGLALVLGALALTRSSDTAGPCADTLHQLDGAWGPERREAVRQAFDAAGLVDRSVLASLDAYASSWTDMRHGSCEATRVAGTQSDELMDLRSGCLDRRRAELGALAELLASGNRSALAEASKSVENLVPLSTCADEARLRTRVPLPADPSARAAIEAGERVLADARARLDAGLYADALARLDSLDHAGPALAHAPLAAAHATLRGRALAARGDHAGAEAAFVAAGLAAARGGDDRLLVEIDLEAMQLVGVSLGKAGEAARLEHATEVALTRIGRPIELERRLRMTRANLRRVEGKPDLALEILQGLRSELDESGEGESALAFDLDRRIAGLLANLGRYDQAEALLLRSIADLEARVGRDHPDLIIPRANLATLYAHRGDLEASRAMHARVIEASERWLGPDHPSTAVAYESLGVLQNNACEHAEARSNLERAAASYASVYEPGHPSLVRVQGNLAAVLIELHDYDLAVQTLLPARAALSERYGDEHDYLVFLNINLGEAYVGLARYDDAIEAIVQARAIALARFGPDNQRIGECYIVEGMAYAGAGKLDEALERYELARTNLTKTESSPAMLIKAELMRALALVETGTRREEGVRALGEVLVRAQAAGDAGPSLVAYVREQAKGVGVELE